MLQQSKFILSILRLKQVKKKKNQIFDRVRIQTSGVGLRYASKLVALDVPLDQWCRVYTSLILSTGMPYVTPGGYVKGHRG